MAGSAPIVQKQPFCAADSSVFWLSWLRLRPSGRGAMRQSAWIRLMHKISPERIPLPILFQIVRASLPFPTLALFFPLLCCRVFPYRINRILFFHAYGYPSFKVFFRSDAEEQQKTGTPYAASRFYMALFSSICSMEFLTLALRAHHCSAVSSAAGDRRTRVPVPRLTSADRVSSCVCPAAGQRGTAPST